MENNKNPKKNYHFERDLKRRVEKSVEIVTVCVLYDATKSIKNVAEHLNMSRNTVKKIVDAHYTEADDCSMVSIFLKGRNEVVERLPVDKNLPNKSIED